MKNIKSVILGIIIGVVLLMFLVFGARLVYERPEYNDYCDYGTKYLTDNLSESQIQEQNEYFRNCNESYEEVRENYSKKMFILSIIVGVLVIAGAAVFVKLESVSGGLMFGSAMFLVYGAGSYWEYMGDWIRFIILGVALGVLIYLGYWLAIRENGKNKKVGKRK